MNRKNFLGYTLGTSAALMLNPFETLSNVHTANKIKLAIVGTGHRGSGFWGKGLLAQLGDYVEFVGLCDINPGRVAYAKSEMKVNCNTYVDYDMMLKSIKADYIIVTTIDGLHHLHIVKALNAGFNVITEKPMTTDEVKCKEILNAELKYNKKVVVAFNYRHSVLAMQLKELLVKQRVGKITSVDFNWYLNVYHGADYFRRWHGNVAKSGSLWVHKATHHFDLLNWWLNSEPEEVMAYGALEHYGKNNSFSGTNCRTCNHKSDCKFYWDITKEERLNNLYPKNEHHDGYYRDGCVYRADIDIYDKMSAQIKYANGVLVNYSLTTYSPYEGWQIAFNGVDGRLETWEDIPYLQSTNDDQANKHITEMNIGNNDKADGFREIFAMNNFEKTHEIYRIPKIKSGHGGGDVRMLNRLFVDKNDNPNHVMAGTREGAMSILIGIAARKSIQLKRPVKIKELTNLKPMANRF